jgi:anti-sigma regulatory factor (Ser/Thr protein kinase)
VSRDELGAGVHLLRSRSVPVLHHFVQCFAALPEAVPSARQWFVQVCTEHGIPADVVRRGQLPISELVANAVRYGECDELYVELDISGDVFVAVHDESVKPPLPQAPGIEDGPGGRGLFLSSVMTDDLGWTETVSGKAVWFLLTTPTDDRQSAG